jgi:hypothetical protein
LDRAQNDPVGSPKLIQEDIKHLIRSSMNNEIEQVMKNLPKKEELRNRWIHCRILPDL